MIVELKTLPKSMAERAIKARSLSGSNPELVQYDDEFIPWVFDTESKTWLSFNGRYSSKSPEEKSQQDNEYKEREKQYKEVVLQRIIEIEKFSKIRQKILDRDKNTCQLCGKKAPSKFHIHHILKRKDKIKEYNKKYQRKYFLKRRYDITLENYSQMVEEQEGKCAICNKPFDSLCVDHNHLTGEVRGLLCSKCNQGIGLLDENIEIFTKAIDYLKKSI